MEVICSQDTPVICGERGARGAFLSRLTTPLVLMLPSIDNPNLEYSISKLIHQKLAFFGRAIQAQLLEQSWLLDSIVTAMTI